MDARHTGFAILFYMTIGKHRFTGIPGQSLAALRLLKRSYRRWQLESCSNFLYESYYPLDMPLGFCNRRRIQSAPKRVYMVAHRSHTTAACMCTLTKLRCSVAFQALLRSLIYENVIANWAITILTLSALCVVW